MTRATSGGPTWDKKLRQFRACGILMVMKASPTAVFLRRGTPVIIAAMLALLVGCAAPRSGRGQGDQADSGLVSTNQGPAHRHAAEFRDELSQSVPVREFGYRIKDLRFNEDYQKALVVFTHPSNMASVPPHQRRPDWEFILEHDGFARYTGTSMQPFYTPGTASTPPVRLTVTLPQ
jgi:hypothetical protein